MDIGNEIIKLFPNWIYDYNSCICINTSDTRSSQISTTFLSFRAELGTNVIKLIIFQISNSSKIFILHQSTSFRMCQLLWAQLQPSGFSVFVLFLFYSVHQVKALISLQILISFQLYLVVCYSYIYDLTVSLFLDFNYQILSIKWSCQNTNFFKEFFTFESHIWFMPI